MNNIKSFNEFTGIELEEIVYNQELNEGIMGRGIKGFFNKRAVGKVRAELADEIEMSKSIMAGIKEGLETLNENFDVIKKSLDGSSDKKKGEKQKLLEDITKIIDNSRKNTWDLNELIDEGEIDYMGFTTNVGIASVAYFGILLTPFRAAVIIHKGYNYFFNIIKNTIRKSLVMLQLNFDQFENLIVTQSLRCAGVITATDSSNEISEFYGNIYAQLFGENSKASKSMSKKQLEKMKVLLKGAKDKFDQQTKADKLKDSAENLYNNLDPYNNTYTKSLEVLRQYAGDDVQKQLDSIKTSISKLAGQDADLQTYGELIIASAEEHAYEVSTSIYNKFAKMTEVFSLPNQQKLIDLILEANKEDRAEAKRLRDEKKIEKKAEEAAKKETDGSELFKSKIGGVELGKMDEETKMYDKDSIKNADKWTYDEFNKLDDDEKDLLESWLQAHPEVLNKCDETLQIAIYSPSNEGYHIYVDSLVDYIGGCLLEKDLMKDNLILNFDDYYHLNESDEKIEKSELKKKVDEIEKEWKDKDDKWLKYTDDDVDERCKKLLSLIFDDDKKISSYKSDDIDKLNMLISFYEKEGGVSEEDNRPSIYKDIYKNLNKLLSKVKDSKKKDKIYYIDFNKIDETQIGHLKDLYSGDGEKLAKVAFKVIGNKLLNDNTFVKNADNIISKINKCFDDVKTSISLMTYNLLSESIEKLKDIRNHDYINVEEEKSEK